AVAAGQRVERRVAHHEWRHAEVVAQRTGQARFIGLLVNAQQRLAIGVFVQQAGRVGLGGDRVFQRLLLGGERIHAESTSAGSPLSAAACTARAWSSSASNSASGGMWSSRSIIVGTPPMRRTV